MAAFGGKSNSSNIDFFGLRKPKCGLSFPSRSFCLDRAAKSLGLSDGAQPPLALQHTRKSVGHLPAQGLWELASGGGWFMWDTTRLQMFHCTPNPFCRAWSLPELNFFQINQVSCKGWQEKTRATYPGRCQHTFNSRFNTSGD